MRDIIELIDEVLNLSDVDVLILFGLIAERTAFKFTTEQCDEIAGKTGDKAILPQVAHLAEDIISIPCDDIKDVFVSVNFQRELIYPIIPPPKPLKDPVFVSRNNGKINRQIFCLRRNCPACKPMDKYSFIDTVERSDIEGSVHVCPICVSEKNKE